MKTAMQELIELLELNTRNEPLPYLIDVIKEVYIQKEKEQIIDAMERAAMYVSAASLDKEIGKMTFEDLYNQTYKCE